MNQKKSTIDIARRKSLSVVNCSITDDVASGALTDL